LGFSINESYLQFSSSDLEMRGCRFILWVVTEGWAIHLVYELCYFSGTVWLLV